MTAIPFRLRVLRALTDRLRGISYTDERGAVNVGDAVFRGRVLFGADDPLPMLSLLESPVQPEAAISPPRGAVMSSRWELVLQGFLPDDHTNPTDPAHFLLAEAKRRLIDIRREQSAETGNRDILGLDGRVQDLRFGPGVVRPPDETSAVAHFYLTLYLEIAEDLAKPYD